MFAIGTDLFVVSGLLPSIGHDLHQSTSAAGQTVTVFAITYALMAPVLASLTSVLDRRSVLVTVLVIFAAGNALSAAAPDFAVLLISRVVAGGAASLFAATASAVAARIAEPEWRGRALAIVYAGMTTAIALGVPIGNVIGDLASWRLAFAFITVLALISGLGVLTSLPTLPGNAGARLRTRLSVVGARRAPTALATTTLWVVGTFVVYTYLGTSLQTVSHADAAVRTWLLLAFGIGSLVGTLTGGRLADRVPATVGLGATIGTLAIVLICLTFALHTIAGAAIGLTVWGAAHWASFPLIQKRLLAIGNTRSDMLLAINNSAVYIGQTVAAILGAALVSAGLIRWLPPAGAAFECLALLALAISARAHHAATTDIEPVRATVRNCAAP
jgi:predicted MFS family arabinose efflux permease